MQLGQGSGYVPAWYYCPRYPLLVQDFGFPCPLLLPWCQATRRVHPCWLRSQPRLPRSVFAFPLALWDFLLACVKT